VTTRRGRRLGVDVGDVRIGVAISDPDGILATPVETVPAGPGAIKRLAEIVHENDVFECIVGLPMGLSGREGPAAIKVRAFCDELSAAIEPVPIRLFDERMSTITADSMLRHSGRSARGKRSIIDQAAATVILQTALDSERSRGSAPGESM
jgi:putative Holliday junction resolvase